MATRTVVHSVNGDFSGGTFVNMELDTINTRIRPESAKAVPWVAFDLSSIGKSLAFVPSTTQDLITFETGTTFMRMRYEDGIWTRISASPAFGGTVNGGRHGIAFDSANVLHIVDGTGSAVKKYSFATDPWTISDSSATVIQNTGVGGNNIDLQIRPGADQMVIVSPQGLGVYNNDLTTDVVGADKAYLRDSSTIWGLGSMQDRTASWDPSDSFGYGYLFPRNGPVDDGSYYAMENNGHVLGGTWSTDYAYFGFNSDSPRDLYFDFSSGNVADSIRGEYWRDDGTFDAVWAVPRGVVDNTTEAGTPAGTKFALLCEPIKEFMYVGHSFQFEGLNISFNNASADTDPGLIVEYWDSSTSKWEFLTLASDTSNRAGGNGSFQWNAPANWGLRDLSNDEPESGESGTTRYWIRFYRTSGDANDIELQMARIRGITTNGGAIDISPLDKVFYVNGSGGSHCYDVTDAITVTTVWWYSEWPHKTHNYTYIGDTGTFDDIDFDFQDVAANVRIRAEYWDGGNWENLTITTDNTSEWTTDGTMLFTAPGDWATLNLQTQESDAPDTTLRYWVRFHMIDDDPATSPTTRVTCNSLQIQLSGGGYSDADAVYWAGVEFASATNNTTEAGTLLGTPFNLITNREDTVFIGVDTADGVFSRVSFDLAASLTINTSGSTFVDRFNTSSWKYWNGSGWIPIDTTIDETFDGLGFFHGTGGVKLPTLTGWTAAQLSDIFDTFITTSAPDDTERYWIKIDCSRNITTQRTVYNIRQGCFEELPGMVDGTTRWTSSGTISWNAPTNWGTRSVYKEVGNTTAADTDAFYWTRFRSQYKSGGGTPTLRNVKTGDDAWPVDSGYTVEDAYITPNGNWILVAQSHGVTAGKLEKIDLTASAYAADASTFVPAGTDNVILVAGNNTHAYTVDSAGYTINKIQISDMTSVDSATITSGQPTMIYWDDTNSLLYLYDSADNLTIFDENLDQVNGMSSGLGWSAGSFGNKMHQSSSGGIYLPLQQDGIVIAAEDQPLSGSGTFTSIVMTTEAASSYISLAMTLADGDDNAFTLPESEIFSVLAIDGATSIFKSSTGRILLGGKQRNNTQNQDKLIWYSDDDGDSWNAATLPSSSPAGYWYCSQIGQTSDADLFAWVAASTGNDSVEFWKSTNDGATWTKVADSTDFGSHGVGVPYRARDMFIFSAGANQDRIVVSMDRDTTSNTSQVYYSDNDGTTWTQSTITAEYYCYALMEDPDGDNNTVYAIQQDTALQLYKSTNGGATFSAMFSKTGIDTTSVITNGLMKSAGEIWLAQYGSIIWKVDTPFTSVSDYEDRIILFDDGTVFDESSVTVDTLNNDDNTTRGVARQALDKDSSGNVWIGAGKQTFMITSAGAISRISRIYGCCGMVEGSGGEIILGLCNPYTAATDVLAVVLKGGQGTIGVETASGPNNSPPGGWEAYMDTSPATISGDGLGSVVPQSTPDEYTTYRITMFASEVLGGTLPYVDGAAAVTLSYDAPFGFSGKQIPTGGSPYRTVVYRRLIS